MSPTLARQNAGTPVGGQFVTTVHTETDLTLDPAADGAPCRSCQTATKRTSGLCRRCDPAKAKTRTVPSPVTGVTRERTSGLLTDTTTASISADQITACTYEFVPVYRNGTLVEDQVRGCKNAILVPAELCHSHGGATATSLGRSVAKATAEAERDQCFPLTAEHWAQTDERLAAAEGQLLVMLGTDTDAIAAMYVAFRAQQSNDGTARFSANNQMLVLVQHYGDAARELEPEAALGRAVELAGEPHKTAADWAKLGRAPLEDERGVAVVWWQPGKPSLAKTAGETDEAFAERLKTAGGGGGWRGKHGALLQFPLSATAGADYTVVADPLSVARPSGFGDPIAARTAMEQVAADMGITVTYHDQKPSGSLAYWKADTSEIAVWKGLGGGDDRALAHALAHELGHARLGHSTDAGAENQSRDKEAAAESFAALACAHHGIDSSAISAHYVKGWRAESGVDMSAAGLAPLRSAIKAFDDYVTAAS